MFAAVKRPFGLFGAPPSFPVSDDPATGGIAGNYPAMQAAPDPHAKLKRIVGIAGDFAAGLAGHTGPYAAMEDERRREAADAAQKQQDYAQQYAMYDYKLAHPEPGQMSDFDQQAVAGGYTPGTPEWTALHKQHVQEIADPVVNTPNGMMLRSQAIAQMGGTPAPAGVTFTPLPEGGPTQHASGNFPNIERYYGGQ